MIGKVFLVSVGLCVALSNGALLTFSGRDLPSYDIGNGYPDAYIEIYYAPSLNERYELYQTTDDIGSFDPDWSDVVDIPYNSAGSQIFKIEMYDADSPDGDDYMGWVEFRYSEIINDADGLLTISLQEGEERGGSLLIKRRST